MNRNASKQNKCPFTKTDVEDAYGPEVSLFLHCHLRGYDKHGEGKFPDHGEVSIIEQQDR
jgi:hypothetical protein